MVEADAIVVGARWRGHLQRCCWCEGYKVLVVDRASFPSDTVSTHVVTHRASLISRWVC
jgi:hypothetical protein